MAMFRLYARGLKHAIDMVESKDLHNELLAAPIITDLVITTGFSPRPYRHLRNADGITIKPVLDTLIYDLKRKM